VTDNLALPFSQSSNQTAGHVRNCTIVLLRLNEDRSRQAGNPLADKLNCSLANLSKVCLFSCRGSPSFSNGVLPSRGAFNDISSKAKRQREIVVRSSSRAALLELFLLQFGQTLFLLTVCSFEKRSADYVGSAIGDYERAPDLTLAEPFPRDSFSLPEP